MGNWKQGQLSCIHRTIRCQQGVLNLAIVWLMQTCNVRL